MLLSALMVPAIRGQWGHHYIHHQSLCSRRAESKDNKWNCHPLTGSLSALLAPPPNTPPPQKKKRKKIYIYLLWQLLFQCMLHKSAFHSISSFPTMSNIHLHYISWRGNKIVMQEGMVSDGRGGGQSWQWRLWALYDMFHGRHYFLFLQWIPSRLYQIWTYLYLIFYNKLGTILFHLYVLLFTSLCAWMSLAGVELWHWDVRPKWSTQSFLPYFIIIFITVLLSKTAETEQIKKGFWTDYEEGCICLHVKGEAVCRPVGLWWRVLVIGERGRVSWLGDWVFWPRNKGQHFVL